MDPSGGTTVGDRPSIFNEQWFQIVWRLILAVVILILFFAVKHAYSIYLKSRGQEWPTMASQAHTANPPSVLTNRQAETLFGTEPGVVISGMHTAHEHRPADGKGNFGKADPVFVVPELQEATQLKLHKLPKSAVGPTALVVAEKTADSDDEDNVPEAIAYRRRSTVVQPPPPRIDGLSTLPTTSSVDVDDDEFEDIELQARV